MERYVCNKCGNDHSFMITTSESYLVYFHLSGKFDVFTREDIDRNHDESLLMVRCSACGSYDILVINIERFAQNEQRVVGRDN